MGKIRHPVSSSEPMFPCRNPYRRERPQVLVVACSDGRLQTAVDEYLSSGLGIVQYDRLFLPGGPGALATSGSEYTRSERHQREFQFLIDAHGIRRVVLIFHGPVPGGPPETVCADYERIAGSGDPDRIREMQLVDAQEIMR